MVYDAQLNHLNRRISDSEMMKFFTHSVKKEQKNSLTIVQKIARADKDAVNECLNFYGDIVWTLAQQFKILPEEKEQAVREIFLDIFKCAEKFDPARLSEKDFIIFIARQRLIKKFGSLVRNLSAIIKI